MEIGASKYEDTNYSNTLNLDGITYKTSGNIVFEEDETSSYYLANSPLLENLDCYLEHGMQTLLKKVKT